MKLFPSSIVAVYSATGCQLYNIKKPSKLESVLSLDQAPFNYLQIERLQQKISFDNVVTDAQLCVVVVPDTWVSVTQHQNDYDIPLLLRPLAALTFATESTFEAPDKLHFSYRYTSIKQQGSRLDVVACTRQRAELFCSPFQTKYESCVLVSYGQWEEAKKHKYPWRRLTKESLSVYNPDFESNRSNQRRWSTLLALSLLINLLAYFYLINVNQATRDALLSFQKSEMDQAYWFDRNAENKVLESALESVRNLPASARLSAFSGQSQKISITVTLPQKELNRILASWQKQYPEWHVQTELLDFNAPFDGHVKGVVDAVISIIEK